MLILNINYIILLYTFKAFQLHYVPIYRAQDKQLYKYIYVDPICGVNNYMYVMYALVKHKKHDCS